METTSINSLLSSLGIESATPSLKRMSHPTNIDAAMNYARQIGLALCPKFVIDDKNAHIYEQLVRWTLGLPFECINPVTKKTANGRVDKGIFLTGATGTGKTLALQVMWYLAKLYGQTVQIGSNIYPLQWRIARSEDICDEYLRTGEVSVLRSTSLCINDLGTEPRETLYMGNRVEVMRQLIERWGDRSDRLLLITSNLPMCYNARNGKEEQRDTVLKRYGARAESRLVEMCNYMFLDGSDRRLDI